MEPLTIDCSGGFSTSCYGVPIGAIESSSINPSTSSAFAAGAYPTVVAEEVEIYEESFLGRGAYAKVVRGKYRGRPCAIKLKIEGDFSKVSEEAKNLHALRHEGVIQLFGALLGLHQGLVVELMEGGSLHDLLHSKKYLSYTAENVVWWSLQCTRALDHIHKLGFVHRDVKPLNFVLDNTYQTLKLCDFGTAVSQKSTMTNDRGTALWMAPEVFKGMKYDAKVDVFSFGIALWEMVTRRFPFEEIGQGGFLVVQWQKLEGKRPPIVAECVKPFADLMTSCWAEEPVDRPYTADVVRILEVLTEVYSVVPPPSVIDLSTSKEARARDYFQMEQNARINKLLSGNPMPEQGPRVYTHPDEHLLPSVAPQQKNSFGDRKALSTDTPQHSLGHSVLSGVSSSTRLSEDLARQDRYRLHTNESESYSPLDFNTSRSSIDAISQSSSTGSGAIEKSRKKRSVPEKIGKIGFCDKRKSTPVAGADKTTGLQLTKSHFSPMFAAFLFGSSSEEPACSQTQESKLQLAYGR